MYQRNYIGPAILHSVVWQGYFLISQGLHMLQTLADILTQPSTAILTTETRKRIGCPFYLLLERSYGKELDPLRQAQFVINRLNTESIERLVKEL